MTPEEVHRVANERLMQMMPQVLPSPDAMGPPAPVPDPATGITQPSAGQLRRYQRNHRLRARPRRLRVRREGNGGELS